MKNNNINLEELLKSLTIEEKIGQLLQLAPFLFNDNNKGEITGPMKDMGIGSKEINLAGSVLGISGAKEMKEIQSQYLAKHDKKIPLLFMADVIHGYRTIYPIPLALGCSWDIDMAEESARVAAKEAAAGGIHVTFSPMVDLVRDPRWGRVMESTGEDPYLNGLYARAFVRGYQGNLTNDDNIAACVKHFAAYGAAEGGRDYNTVDMSERTLREYYLPAYKAAVDEGARMLMTSFNVVDGVPSSGNEWLMRDLLRDEWNFDGVVISDWGAVAELIPHGVAEDGKEAAEKALKAGVDIEMMTTHYVHHLKELIELGKIDESLLDESVLRILQLKKDLGLFENPFRGADEELEAKLILCDEHRESVRRAAEKSMVLLKNEGVLPLSKDVKKVAVVGPFADNQMILGGWAWQGKFEETVTLKEGLINKLGEDRVLVAKGCDSELPERVKTAMSEEGFEEAIRIAKEAEVVILALGEHFDLSGEGGCRTNIKLPNVQEKLAREILALNKPTAVVLFNGRPLDITELSNEATDILEAWYPGTEGGNAVANVLFGDANPQGRLTMAFPYSVGQVPVYYNCLNTGRPKMKEYGELHTFGEDRYCSHYLDAPNAPLYPFGYGLSYTTFKYGEATINKDSMTMEEKLTVKVTVKNEGKVAGTETVQFYIRDISGSVSRPLKELKGFKQVTLAAGQETEVEFEINEEMLRFNTLRNGFASEKGKFIAMVGPNSKEVQELEFELI